jgi:hypothetical protein
VLEVGGWGEMGGEGGREERFEWLVLG